MLNIRNADVKLDGTLVDASCPFEKCTGTRRTSV